MDVPAGIEVTHIAGVLGDFVRSGRIKLKAGAFDNDGVITFHDACKIQRRGGHINEPREILKILAPNAFIVPMIVFLSFVGSFPMRNRVEDILVTIIFGLLGYALSKRGYPAICLLLGFVLGDLTEANFHRSVLIGHGSYAVFVESTISIVLFSLTILALIGPYLVSLGKRFLTKTK